MKEGPGGSMSQVVGLPNRNSYKPNIAESGAKPKKSNQPLMKEGQSWS